MKSCVFHLAGSENGSPRKMTAGDAQLCHTSAEDPMVLGCGGAAAQAGAHLHMFNKFFPPI